MTYSEKIQEQLKGKTISSADVDGHRVFLIFTDRSQFNYDASDGGYSCFGLYGPKGDKCDNDHDCEHCDWVECPN